MEQKRRKYDGNDANLARRRKAFCRKLDWAPILISREGSESPDTWKNKAKGMVASYTLSDVASLYVLNGQVHVVTSGSDWTIVSTLLPNNERICIWRKKLVA